MSMGAAGQAEGGSNCTVGMSAEPTVYAQPSWPRTMAIYYMPPQVVKNMVDFCGDLPLQCWRYDGGRPVLTHIMRRLILLAAVAAPLIVAQPVILQGPVVDAISYSSARITWLTDQPADTMIRYGRTALDAESADANIHTTHSWYVSGLAAGTTYRYQVCSKDRSGARTCSDERTFTTEAATDELPRVPLPPKQYVDTSMPGGFGEPFVVDESCSNLPDVLGRIASLSGDSNHEILIPARTTCSGLWTFPRRPNHTGWIVVKSMGTLPAEGVRVGPEDYREMARLVTDALPGGRLSLVSFPPTCNPGAYIWGNVVPDMALFICNYQGDSGGSRGITEYNRGESSVVLTVPGHGYRSGNVVTVTGTTAVDSAWRITVVDDDHFTLDGARPTRGYSGSGQVVRKDWWTLVPHRSGPELPADCIANDWFLRTNGGAPVDNVYWCTSENTWTRVRLGNYGTGASVAAIRFQEGASRYRFVGIEVTHNPVPSPPPPDWNRPDYKQGSYGSLVVTDASNDRIIFDRCDIHGHDYPARVGRGVYLNGSNVGIINSRVHKITRWGGEDGFATEATAIDISTGPGPGILENNFLEAIGITVFFPNAGKHLMPPADYVIRKNYFSHPETYLAGSAKNWSGKIYNNRQVLELKVGQRMIVEGNVFDGNWADITQGAMVLLTPREDPGSVRPKTITKIEEGVLEVAANAAADPYTPGLLVSVQGTGSQLDGIWEVVEALSPRMFRLKDMPSGSASAGTVFAVTSHMQISDIDIRSNIFRNGPNLLWMNGHDLSPTTRTTQRIRFHNNLVTGMDSRSAREGGRVTGGNKEGRSGIGIFAAFGMEDLIVTNNTIFDFKGKAPTFFFFDSTRYGAHSGLMVRDNIFTADKATIASISGQVPGAESLNRQWTNHPDSKWAFRNNVLCCDIKNKTPDDNLWPDSLAEIGFLNPLLGSVQLQSNSRYATSGTTGGSIGVNIQELEAALGTTLDSLAAVFAAKAKPVEAHRARTASVPSR